MTSFSHVHNNIWSKYIKNKQNQMIFTVLKTRHTKSKGHKLTSPKKHKLKRLNTGPNLTHGTTREASTRVGNQTWRERHMLKRAPLSSPTERLHRTKLLIEPLGSTRNTTTKETSNDYVKSIVFNTYTYNRYSESFNRSKSRSHPQTEPPNTKTESSHRSRPPRKPSTTLQILTTNQPTTNTPDVQWIQKPATNTEEDGLNPE
ncbi:hypothetical protein YC2023_091984 [Brassica napus]